jgi:hypothetical protein
MWTCLFSHRFLDEPGRDRGTDRNLWAVQTGYGTLLHVALDYDQHPLDKWQPFWDHVLIVHY